MGREETEGVRERYCEGDGPVRLHISWTQMPMKEDSHSLAADR